MFNVIKQSGVIPYRIKKGNVEILLITSSKGKRWIVPKGWIEPHMSSADSAVKEAYEEAGVLGSIITPAIGSYESRKWGLPCSVEIFLMKVETVLDNWEEAHTRERKWLSVDKAIDWVDGKNLKQILQRCQQELAASALQGQ
ncbi:MAG: NUDIX hydrolase [Elainellaceae cyanobacterium]